MRDSLHNHNSRMYFDSFPVHLSNNMKRFTYLEDTTNNRAAAYVAAIYVDTGLKLVHGVVRYGRIGKQLTEQVVYTADYFNQESLDLELQVTHRTIENKISVKTNKNYRIVDDIQVTTSKVRPDSGTHLSLMSILARTITITVDDLPILVEYSDAQQNHESLIKNEAIIFECHPDRIRMIFITFTHQGVGIYNASGNLTGCKDYDLKCHNITGEFNELIQSGVVFIGHLDSNDNIVIQRYISHISRPPKQKPLTWAQQKTITTLIMNTLYNDKEDIYDSNLPIYCADYVVNESDKRAMINNRGHGYANNVTFFYPHEVIDMIKHLER